MSIKVEKTENNNELKLTFTVEAAKFDEGMEKVYHKNVKYFNIPGFRKGKAPMNMVEKTYGPEIFYEDAFNEIVPEIFDEELKANNIIAVSRPDIDVIQIGKGKDLIFTAVVQTKPEVKLGKYKGIALDKVEYKVEDADIEKELTQMGEKNARIVSVDDRAAKSGDITVIDFEGFVDGKAFEGGKGENYELTLGSNTFIPGFEDQVAGMKIDEDKDVKVKFPDEYFSKDLAGKEATFKVKLHEIKVKELPKMDDEFAKDVSEFDTLVELKASIKTKLEEENTSKAKYELEEAAIKKVCDATEVEIPSGMIDTEVENMIKDFSTRLQYQGIALDQYLKMVGKEMDAFKEEFREQAQTAVKTRLTLEEIIKTEKLEASEDEIVAKVKEMATNYGREEKELLENDNLKEYISENMKNEKAIKFVIDNAKIK